MLRPLAISFEVTLAKLISLAAVGLLLFLVLPGASASADVLCEESLQLVEEEVEACAAPYAEPTVVEGSAAEAVFVAGEFKVTCKSTLSWKNEKDLGVGKGMEGKIESLAFSSCKGTCSSAKAEPLPFNALGKPGKEGNGSLTITGGEKGNPGLVFSSCFGSLSCGYAAKELVFSVNGGEPGQIEASKVSAEKVSGGVLCPASGALSAGYVLLAPNAGTLAMAQDTVGVTITPGVLTMTLGQSKKLEVKNTGTARWNITDVKVTDPTNFDVIDPWPGETKCKGTSLTAGASCVTGAKCLVANKAEAFEIVTAIGTFTPAVICN